MQKIINLDLKNIKRYLTGGEKIIVLGFLTIVFGFVFSNSTFASENITTNVSIEPSLTVTIPSAPLVLNLDPASITSGTNNLTITVGTNNATGYKMTMSTTSDNTNLVHTEDSTIVIPTLDTGTSFANLSDFPVNKWGYKKDSGNFIPFASPTIILESDTYANNDTTTLSFATKIDYLQESGAYNTTFQFNTVANPLVTYIQNLNPSLCTEEPLTVVDGRDDQEYIVQRLADGNCWMMTNLNLGAVELTKDLTSDNTNLSTTITAATFNGWRKTTGSGTYTAGEYIPVSGTDSTSLTPYGTLYNYCATSAGTICTSSNSSNATYDICPKGWRLPTGGTSGEFRNLYNQSEYNSLAKMRAPIVDGGAAFALGGRFVSGGIQLNGTSGFYYSSTRGTGNYMYDLRLNTTTVSPAFSPDSITQNYGRSIRCILK